MALMGLDEEKWWIGARIVVAILTRIREIMDCIVIMDFQTAVYHGNLLWHEKTPELIGAFPSFAVTYNSYHHPSGLVVKYSPMSAIMFPQSDRSAENLN
jgi:hypothetical protein